MACSEDGIACFDHVRYRRHDGRVFFYAFDLIELDGEDMRRDPLEHLDEEDGPLVFAHACKMGLERIVSKHGLALSFRPSLGLLCFGEWGR